MYEGTGPRGPGPVGGRRALTRRSSQLWGALPPLFGIAPPASHPGRGFFILTLQESVGYRTPEWQPEAQPAQLDGGYPSAR